MLETIEWGSAGIKNFFKVMLFSVLILGLTAASAFADDRQVVVFVDKVKLEFPDQQPFLDGNGRTLIPVRFVSEALGADVQWNDKRQTITITKGASNIVLTVGQNTLRLNGQTKKMDTTAVITAQGRTMVPLRFVSEALGESVGWDGDTSSVYIGKGSEDFVNSSPKTLGSWKIFDPLADYKYSQLGDLAFGNGHFVLRAYNIQTHSHEFFISTDGSNWTFVNDVGKDFGDGIFFVNGKFMSWWYDDCLWTSDDGNRWSQNKPNITGQYVHYSTGGKHSRRDIAYGNGKYVAVGGTNIGTPPVVLWAPLIYVSSDAINWKLIDLQPLVDISERLESIDKVTFGNGCFVANSSNDNLYISRDGDNWEKMPFDGYIKDLTYGNGFFIATGSKDREGVFVWKSADGIHWSEHSIERVTSSEWSWDDISYGGGLFVMTGGINGEIAISTDGEHWTRQQSDAQAPLTGFVYGNGTFVGITSETLVFGGSSSQGKKRMMITNKFE